MKNQIKKVMSSVEDAKKTKRNLKINSIKLSLKQTILKKNEYILEDCDLQMNKVQSCIELEGNFKRGKGSSITTSTNSNDDKTIKMSLRPQ